MAKGNLRLVSPRTVIGTVPPRRYRLTEPEVERLIAAAKANRNGAARCDHDSDRVPTWWLVGRGCDFALTLMAVANGTA